MLDLFERKNVADRQPIVGSAGNFFDRKQSLAEFFHEWNVKAAQMPFIRHFFRECREDELKYFQFDQNVLETLNQRLIRSGDDDFFCSGVRYVPEFFEQQVGAGNMFDHFAAIDVRI